MAQQQTIPPENEPLVATSCFDFLLIELVPMAERMARAYEASLDRPSLANKPPVVVVVGQNQQAHAHTTSVSTTATTTTTKSVTSTNPNPNANANTNQRPQSQSGNNTGPPSLSGQVAQGPGTATIALTYDGLPETEVFKDSVFFRLELLGYRVGQGLSEKFSRDRPRFTDHLDVIKFLCKDLWGVVFKKQIDNLKTNHRGVFVLTDSKFRPFTRMSMASNTEAVMRAQPHLYFPCGIIRGVLSSLGIKATVQAETSELPVAIFQIKTTTKS